MKLAPSTPRAASTSLLTTCRPRLRRLLALVFLMALVGCKKGGVCVVHQDTLHGPETHCKYGVSYEIDRGWCDAYKGEFHPYAGSGKTLADRGTDTCRELGVSPEPQ